MSKCNFIQSTPQTNQIRHKNHSHIESNIQSTPQTNLTQKKVIDCPVCLASDATARAKDRANNVLPPPENYQCNTEG